MTPAPRQDATKNLTEDEPTTPTGCATPMSRAQEFANLLIHPAFLGSMIFDFSNQLIQELPQAVWSDGTVSPVWPTLSVLTLKLCLLVLYCLDFVFTQPIRERRRPAITVCVVLLFYIGFHTAALGTQPVGLFRYATDLLLAVLALTYGTVDAPPQWRGLTPRLNWIAFVCAAAMGAWHACLPIDQGWPTIITCLAGMVCFAIAIRTT